MAPSAVALIPARAGSKRVPGKNVRELAGHPLIAYSIAAATQSGKFDSIVVSTDSEEIAAIAEQYGAEVPSLRPAELAGPTSPDIAWVRHVLDELSDDGREFDVFSILRPTSPFRSAATIQRAFEVFETLGDRCDSLRAIKLCQEHPGKMWVLEGELMRPLLEQAAEGVPTHSRQYQDLPTIYVQDSSLEIAWTSVAEAGSIAGDRVAPFESEGHEGFSIDYPADWHLAEQAIASGAAELPPVGVARR
jgi:CMP-N,N'-diacetyllegionaminic acid synthase